MTKAEEKIYESIFCDGKQMLSSEIDSVNFHAMTHEDTEILGMFCDFTGIHGEDLKWLLIRGYLRNDFKESKKFIQEFNDNMVSDEFLNSCNKAGKLFNK